MMTVKLKTLAVRSSSRLETPSGRFGPLGTDRCQAPCVSMPLNLTEVRKVLLLQVVGTRAGQGIASSSWDIKAQGWTGGSQADLKPKRYYKIALAGLVNKWNCTQPKLFLC